MVLELGWLKLIGLILVVIVVYTYLFLIAYRKFMGTQEGRYLFNMPLATFSIKSRMHVIKEQVGVKEEEIDYLGNGLFEVRGERIKVEAFFGVVANKVDEEGSVIGVYDGDVLRFNLPNLKAENQPKEDGGSKDG